MVCRWAPPVRNGIIPPSPPSLLPPSLGMSAFLLSYLQSPCLSLSACYRGYLNRSALSCLGSSLVCPGQVIVCFQPGIVASLELAAWGNGVQAARTGSPPGPGLPPPPPPQAQQEYVTCPMDEGCRKAEEEERSRAQQQSCMERHLPPPSPPLVIGATAI